MPNLAKSLGYIKCYSQVSPDLLKALAILSDATVRRSAVDWEDPNHTGNQKKGHVSLGDQQAYYKFLKDFTYHRKKTNMAVVFSCSPFPNILKYYSRVQLVYLNIQVHNSLEPPLEHNQDQMSLMNQGLLWTFNHSVSYRNIIQFQISSRRESR